MEVVRTWADAQNAVFRLDGQRYLKLYHRNAGRQFPIERCALLALAAGGIPAPRLLAAAERTGAPSYVIVTAIPGASAEHTWGDLSRSEQLALARSFGAVTRACQQLPPGDLAAVERQVGGGRDSIAFEREQRLAEIVAAPTLPEARRTLFDPLPSASREDLIQFIYGEARDYCAAQPVFNHADLSHAHVFISNTTGAWALSGVIDWAEAMLVPAEWDITFLWFWTFTRDREAMRACLEAYFDGARPPARYARRCLAATLHSYQWVEVWHSLRDEFAREQRSGPWVRQMTAFLFPPEVFGEPD